MISGEKNKTLNGLVLAGGKSRRMGSDKSVMRWHEQEQRYYMTDLLQLFCNEVFISCREEQVPEIQDGYQALADAYTDAGPLGAILTALEKNDNCAWLVVACDLPLLDADTLRFLIDNRDTEAIATTFKSPHDGLPEPLITIWEPRAKDTLQAFFSEGIKCPRKALLRNENNVKMLDAPVASALLNANTPEDAAMVQQLLSANNTTGR